MGQLRKQNFGRAISPLAAIALGVSFALSQPFGASAVDQKSQALSEFRANLRSNTDLAKFDAFTPFQRDQLGSFLIGETDPFSKSNSADSALSEFEITNGQSVSTPATRVATLLTTTTKSISAWQAYVFAGITISKTSVRETYYVSANNATAIATYSCVVDANYDPLAAITTAKDGAWISGGNATAECLVTVRRGVPTPLGQISWSTKDEIQFVTGNGYGGVIAHGWR